MPLLVTGISELAVCAGSDRPLAGEALLRAGLVRDAALLVEGDRIAAAGPADEVEPLARSRHGKGLETLDARGGFVAPGFVDSHTHALFAGTREAEFAMRVAGAKYLDILAAGGGILSSVRRLADATEDELIAETLPRLLRMFEHGTTTVEIKSGYGLSPELEMKSLRAIRRLRGMVPLDLRATFCGAHAVPPEYKGRSGDFVDLLIAKAMPAIAREGLADFCDIFVEEGVFTVEDGRRYLLAAKHLGLAPKLHADEIHPLGGAELAAEVGAVSADHLLAATPEGLARMAEAGVVATYLPGTLYSLMGGRYPSFREVHSTGVAMALASDFNPGSNYAFNMQNVVSQGALLLRAPVEASLNMATVNGAHALAMAREVGSLEPGKKADFVIYDVPSHLHLAYHYGSNMARFVVKAGVPREVPRLAMESFLRAGTAN